MSLLVNDNLDVAVARHVDSRYGPYDTITDCLSSIHSYKRCKGLTAGVLFSGRVKEYWFKEGTEDSDFVEKRDFSGYTVTGTSYTLALKDEDSIISTTSSLATTITIPSNTTTAFSVPTKITLVQEGLGQITITPAADVTLNSVGAKNKSSAQYGVLYLFQTNTNSWILSGDISS